MKTWIYLSESLFTLLRRAESGLLEINHQQEPADSAGMKEGMSLSHTG